MTPIDDLLAEAAAIRELGASVIDATDIGTYAIEYALHGWQVGPLCKRARDDRGRITKRILSPHGKDPVGKLIPHGVLDFTNDVDTVIKWWSQGPWNIGIRPPESVLVLDVESIEGHGKDGLGALAQLEAKWGPLPPCPTVITGTGGKHLYLRRPPGKLSDARLPEGIEYKTHSGYVVAPPSFHPTTGRPYVWA